MNFRYPIFLDVAGKRCVLVGEGYELPSKVKTLVERGALVTYVNPRAEESIAELAAAGRIEWRRRDFEPGDLSECFLVITDRADNSEVFRLAEERRILCNAVDDPDHCRFSFGSVIPRGDLTVAVSTNGVAPALAVRLRERFEREIGEEYQRFLATLSEMRGEITREIPDFSKRRELWYRLVDSGALTLLRQGRAEDARTLLRGLVTEAAACESSNETEAR
jgi:precorrin-2 dehydrogenase / sirohydrochlorin ferrochelatase